MTSLPQPPAPIPAQLCSGVLWAFPPTQGPFSPGRASVDLSPVWFPKGPCKGGWSRVLGLNGVRVPRKKCLCGWTVLSP